MIDSLSMAVHAFASHILMSFSVYETASEVGELVHKFQISFILSGDIASLYIYKYIYI